MPSLDPGFSFKVVALAGHPGGDGPSVKITIEDAAGTVYATEIVSTASVSDEASLVALVEVKATPMAQAFNIARNLQGWIDNNWPAP
jgi:hypothetical protein